MKSKKAVPPARLQQPKRVAIIGAGMAGITAARTLAKAGYEVSIFEKSKGLGGRMSTRRSDFGTFDHGAQYFTVRDARFRKMIDWARATSPLIVCPWVTPHASARPKPEQHWVAQPGMNALVSHMAAPFLKKSRTQMPTGSQLHLQTRVQNIKLVSQSRGNAAQWQITAVNAKGKMSVYADFDQLLLAIPSPQASELLAGSGLAAPWVTALSSVVVAPSWTLMAAFPLAAVSASNEVLGRLKIAAPIGPDWSAAYSPHPRLAWVARESSKPGRGPIERWTAQANTAWSIEHLEDDEETVKAKLLKAFAEITGIRAEPEHAQVHRWRYAKTETPLGKSFLWDAKKGLGLCGDWCLGHRVENAFVSGLELAMKVIKTG